MDSTLEREKTTKTSREASSMHARETEHLKRVLAAANELKQAVDALEIERSEDAAESACMAARSTWAELLAAWPEGIELLGPVGLQIHRFIRRARSVVAEIQPRTEFVDHCLEGLSDKAALVHQLIIDRDIEKVRQSLESPEPASSSASP